MTRMAEVSIAQRHTAIRRVTSPLPGSQPRENFKPLNIPADCDGVTLLTALGRMVKAKPPAYWEGECTRGLVVDLARKPIAVTQVVRAGERYRHLFPNVIEPAVNADIEVLHEDEALIVVNKPAPLPMHAGGRFYRNTLQHILDLVYQPQKLRPAHRLDANTTGIVLIARTPLCAGRLQPQFAQGLVEKLYLVRVQGSPKEEVFTCDAPISARSGELGSRSVDMAAGQAARTGFHVLQRNSDGTALLAARPFTGRTNQIRVHLWHLGLPVCGDPVYRPGGKLGHVQTLSVGDPPLCLHAWQIKCVHPLTGQPIQFTAPPPAWAGAAFSGTRLPEV